MAPRVRDGGEEGIGGIGEYLSDVLPLDLRRFGLLGNDTRAPVVTRLTCQPRTLTRRPT